MTNVTEQNIRHFLTGRRWRAAIATAAIAVIVGSSAIVLSAHERRVVGAGRYLLVVGFGTEPAFEDVVNSAEVVILRARDQRPINTALGDVVDLSVEVQLRAEEAFDSDIVQAANLAKPAQGFNNPGRYFSYFRPTVDGTYAFRIRGTIWDRSDPAGVGPVTIDETFVCGAGSSGAPAGLGAFNCVRDPQTFPQGASDQHGRDRHGYVDDDSLRPFRQQHDREDD
jgi:hypothetical protein